MLVLLGPRYSASEQELRILGAATELSAYDLRARLRPGAWSVVRAMADAELAEQMAARLRAQGLQCCALDSTIGQDAARRIVYLRGVEVTDGTVALRLAERAMNVPVGALLTIVRGDVHLGRLPLSVTSQSSSQSMRVAAKAQGLLTSNPAPAEVFREPRTQSIQDVFVAADLHFVTVPWIARIDARDCEYPGRGSEVASYAERLDRFIEHLAEAAHIRVDREVKVSSLASHTAGTQRMATPPPTGPISTRRGSASSTDEHFDAYSRMVGEAERRAFGFR